VLALLEREKEFHTISNMKISLSRNKTVFIPERIIETNVESNTERSTVTNTEITHGDDAGLPVFGVTGLSCPDILFQIEVE